MNVVQYKQQHSANEKEQRMTLLKRIQEYVRRNPAMCIVDVLIVGYVLKVYTESGLKAAAVLIAGGVLFALVFNAVLRRRLGLTRSK
jgi:hypothetical protein